MLVFGDKCGLPLIIFPTSGARYYGNKDFGLIGALGWHIDIGKVTVYCPDGIDLESVTAPLRRSIPSKVGNGAAREAATWAGRPEAERMGTERIKFRSIIAGCSAGFLEYASLRSE
jgi:esterase/lipase superfamily enzyme